MKIRNGHQPIAYYQTEVDLAQNRGLLKPGFHKYYPKRVMPAGYKPLAYVPEVTLTGPRVPFSREVNLGSSTIDILRGVTPEVAQKLFNQTHVGTVGQLARAGKATIRFAAEAGVSPADIQNLLNLAAALKPLTSTIKQGMPF